MFPLPIYVAGHRGMVGSAVVRQLTELGVTGSHIVTATRDELDLRDARRVEQFFATHRPQTVVFAAGKVGGILANASYPAEFLCENLAMASSVIHAAFQSKTHRFLFLGSMCIYPRDCPQPIREEYLLTGPLEATNEAYALAKIAGLKLCQHFRSQYGVTFHSAMPTNLYGPGDNYHLQHGHVLPTLLRRIHEAHQQRLPEVTVWGTGTPRREFLHVDDLARAIVHLLLLDAPPDWVNVGTGQDIAIMDLAHLLAEIVGYCGRIVTDPSKPDGTPVKRTDCSRMNALGWQPAIDLRRGIAETYSQFQDRETKIQT